ncbi:MAG TPA: hypothetical protein VK843_06680, partial [Planctomycetota bacterium]|nr:hypothetical protein [Planctomycetota bacterium]
FHATLGDVGRRGLVSRCSARERRHGRLLPGRAARIVEASKRFELDSAHAFSTQKCESEQAHGRHRERS